MLPSLCLIFSERGNILQPQSLINIVSEDFYPERKEVSTSNIELVGIFLTQFNRNTVYLVKGLGKGWNIREGQLPLVSQETNLGDGHWAQILWIQCKDFEQDIHG